MKLTGKEIYEAKAKILKALAHPSRLLIVDSLEKGEKCVCEIHKLVGADRTTVSKHLSVLKNAGILEDEKKGLKIFYKLRCPCVLKFISCLEDVLLKDLEEIKKITSGFKV